MRCPVPTLSCVFVTAILFGTLHAQEVRFADGVVLAGAVVAVDGTRAKVKTTDGAMRTVDVRTIDFEQAADGKQKRYSATLVAGALDAPAQALLARLRKGEEVLLPELMQSTQVCTAELVAALTELASGKTKARTAAALALALSGTKEGVRAALDAAVADKSGGTLKAIAGTLTNGACLAAIEALDAKKDVEIGLASKDRLVRFPCAWVAAKLGSTAALPVLTAFVGDADHHVRESAAICLAECADASGSKVLLTMARRERSPAMDANRDADPATRELIARGARRERERCCELLGALKVKDAIPTLTALAKHQDTAIAAAAQKALAAINGA